MNLTEEELRDLERTCATSLEEHKRMLKRYVLFALAVFIFMGCGLKWIATYRSVTAGQAMMFSMFVLASSQVGGFLYSLAIYRHIKIIHYMDRELHRAGAKNSFVKDELENGDWTS